MNRKKTRNGWQRLACSQPSIALVPLAVKVVKQNQVLIAAVPKSSAP